MLTTSQRHYNHSNKTKQVKPKIHVCIIYSPGNIGTGIRLRSVRIANLSSVTGVLMGA